MIIAIQPDGSLQFVYQDEFAGLLDEGAAAIARASRIEPWGENGREWYAEIYGGPTLGPFDLRQEAIAAEVNWIEKHRLGVREGES